MGEAPEKPPAPVPGVVVLGVAGVVVEPGLVVPGVAVPGVVPGVAVLPGATVAGAAVSVVVSGLVVVVPGGGPESGARIGGILVASRVITKFTKSCHQTGAKTRTTRTMRTGTGFNL